MSESSEVTWQTYFGFSDPYENQNDVIENIIDTAQDSGYLAMEGPCGTGKTMASLTAASYLIRETDQFNNAIVVTPVKQQRQQFVEDLRVINSQLEEPLAGVALVGKRDLCPYGREDVFPDGSSVQERCDDLREATADLVSEDSNLKVQQQFETDATPDSSPIPEEEKWWDPAKGRVLVENAQRDPMDEDASPLHTAGRTAPYARNQPSTTPEMTESGNRQLYCPFEADWYGRDKGSPVTFESGDNHVVTTEELLPNAVEIGTCPHRAMTVLMKNADIVVGNYNHLFDDASRHLTAPILDEQTLVIIDEAHRMEERVRDLLTDTIGYYTVKRAKNDLEQVLRPARQGPQNKRDIKARLAAHDVPFEAVETAEAFYDDVMEWFETQVDDELRDQFEQYGTGLSWNSLPDEDIEVPLRDPDEPEPDEFTRWAEQVGYGGDTFRMLSKVGLAVEQALEQEDIDRDCVCTAVGALFGQWWERDHVDYFREIELEYSRKDDRDVEKPWMNYYNASLVMYNCMPSEKIKEILDEFGGGVLMSATLEPLSIFEEVTGLEELATDEEEPRVVSSRTYDLTFPEENRASWIVDVEAFKKRNRGEPALENTNSTRERYAYVAREIARSHGNILLAWPNYSEAEWAANRLREEIEKPVLLDQSSSHEETRELKREFVHGEPKVLVTSTRGTLTEGVDYEGDELHTCAVFGIPLVNIGSPRVRAVQYAYGDRFGAENSFTYALTIPAVRQIRQAFGRVIRGPDERGVRIVVGERFVPDTLHSVYEYFPEKEREEFVRMKPDFLASQFRDFWES
ncbi:DEAD/DEAH box helicase family protein [Natronorubrum sp. JWXQ-INN-674]|uniref:DEAD/DEAH box helicase family protein n=1 Tax=Natronorubrum halalkaliphilum TaxID=2691917 RepID=A0A6B0VH21_9EURY|nr:ATP-dependent DNA helicase [Natronorubrum halalkaliphilum]MXV60784.1 DEAD/DEAH box helicase family protein [Natronorubrum halalkaliphilum]